MQSVVYISALIAIIIGAIFFMRWFGGIVALKIRNAWIRLVCILVVGGVLVVLVGFCMFAVSLSLSPVAEIHE